VPAPAFVMPAVPARMESIVPEMDVSTVIVLLPDVAPVSEIVPPVNR